MKLVVAYCRLHPKTMAAVVRDFDSIATGQPDHRDVMGARFVDVSGSDEANWELLRDMWAEGQTFIHLEQDKVPAPGALAALYECPESWCAYPVEPIAGFPTLCCTKFGAELMAKYPDLMERVATVNLGFYDGKPIVGSHFRRLDMAVALWMTRLAHVQCHWHPAGLVEHLHEQPAELGVSA